MAEMISVFVDTAKTREGLTDLKLKQYPFALALALTQTAKASASFVRINTRTKFKLHTEFIPKGVRIEAAKKSDARAGRAFSVVKTAPVISGFMPIHETGGTRTPKNTSIALPGKTLRSRKFKTRTGKIKKRWKPATLLAGNVARTAKRARTGRVGKPFIIGETQGHPPLIVRRRGKKQYPLEILYAFRPMASYEKKWDFEKTVKKVAPRAFPRKFEKAMARAIATAKG